MNLVDVLKQQLSGDVANKLGGMAGLNPSDLQKTLGAGLPGLLSGLGALASTKQGAGKIADALGGMDSSLFGNLAGMLGSGAMQKGGSLLSGLLGGGVVDGVAAAIAKITGINASLVKTALGFLAPMVLGGIGNSFKGAKPDAAGISRLFAEQKQNIAGAMPAGLDLSTIPGFQALTAPSVAPTATTGGGGLGKLLVPGGILAAILGGGWWFFNQGGDQAANNVANSASNIASSATTTMQESAQDAVAAVSEQAKETVNTAADTASKLADSAKEVVGKATDAAVSAIPNLDSLKSNLTSMFDQLGGDLGKITDAKSAEAVLPALKEKIGSLDTITKSMSAVPEQGRSMIGSLVKAQLDKLNPIIDKITALPGIGDAAKQILTQLKEKLAALLG